MKEMYRKHNIYHLVAFAIFLFCSSLPAHADERILAFHSDIRVHEDAGMDVTETITVRAERKKINRGIYRDFPTRYRDRLGNSYKVGFKIINVQRDGRSEDYHTGSRSNGIRIYFGRKDHLLTPGVYTYAFSYRTNRQLGFFDNHDELYWNVTGNDWDFPIDRASASIYLPEAVPANRVTAEAYTGRQGSKEQAYTTSREKGGTVYLEASRPLNKREGFTIVVGWPKGFVVEPTFKDKLRYLFNDNLHLFFAAIGLIIVLTYYLFVWRLVGKDPDAGVIIARYEPPDNFSPASLRFIEKMGYDKTCFAAAVINLAVKGFLTIRENDKEYTLEKTGKKVKMAAGEAALVKNLFKDGDSIRLKQSNHARIRKALKAHEASLERDYEKKYFITNIGYFIFGIVLTLAVVLVSLFQMPHQAETGASVFMTVWLSIWSIAVFSLSANAFRAWRQASGFINIGNAISATFMAAVFLFFEIMALGAFAQLGSWSLLIMVVTAALINWLFFELLKAPTRAGRRLLDKVDGFRRYIDIAEKQDLDYKHPKGRCPELFEAYLPYALALGVEQKWGEQFADVLVKTTVAGGAAYSPSWYQGSSWNNYHIGDFSSSLGSSFTTAIASASTAPGSSSGARLSQV